MIYKQNLKLIHGLVISIGIHFAILTLPLFSKRSAIVLTQSTYNVSIGEHHKREQIRNTPKHTDGNGKKKTMLTVDNLVSEQRPSVTPLNPAHPYFVNVQSLIDANIHYPTRLKRMRVFGQVELQFYVNSQGEILDVHVSQSSGNLELDQVSVWAVLASSPLPAPPTDLLPLLLKLPIEYRP